MYLKTSLPYINTFCYGSLASIITSRPSLFLLNIGTGNKQYTNDGHIHIYTFLSVTYDNLLNPIFSHIANSTLA